MRSQIFQERNNEHKDGMIMKKVIQKNNREKLMS